MPSEAWYPICCLLTSTEIARTGDLQFPWKIATDRPFLPHEA